MTQYQRQKGFIPWVKRYISFTLVASVAILVYLMFFTDNSVSTNYAQSLRNDSLRREIKIETDSLNYYRLQNQLLTTDPATLEQVVREHFHMQRKGEDIFIIEQ